MTDLSISMQLWNFSAPFVDEKLAAQLVRAIVESKYGPDWFIVDGEALVEDAGECWSVVFRNKLKPESARSIMSKKVGFKIRKSNAEIVGLTGG